MANIQSNLNKIKNAVLGVEVRDSIHDGIKAMNEEVEKTTGKQDQLEESFDVLNSKFNRIDFNNSSFQELSTKLNGEVYGVITNIPMIHKQVNSANGQWIDVENRCSSTFGYKLNKGDTIGLTDYENYSISFFKFSSSGNFIGSINWHTTDIVVEDDDNIYYPYVKKNDNSELSYSDLQTISKVVKITKKNYIGKYANDCYDAFSDYRNVNAGLSMVRHIEDNYNTNIINQQLLTSDKIQNIPITWGSIDNGNHVYNIKTRCITMGTIRTHTYDKICLSDYDTFSWTMFAYDLNGGNPQSCGWQTKDFDISTSTWKDCLIEFVFKKNDESEFTVDDIEYLSKCFYIQKSSYSDNHTYKLDNLSYMKDIMMDDISELRSNVYGEITNLPLMYKTWDISTEAWINTNDRVITIDPITIEVGDIIQLKDTENYAYAYYLFDNNGNFVSGTSWNTDIITVDSNSELLNRQAYFLFRRADRALIGSGELEKISSNFIITRHKNALTKLQNLDNEVNKLRLGIDTLVDIKLDYSVGEIASGNYYQLVDSAFGDNTMPYHLLVKTTDTTGNFGGYICLRQRINDNRNARRINSIYIGDGCYYVEGFTYDSTTSGYGEMEIFIDLRTSSQSLTVEYYKLLQPGTKSSNSESGEVILYVSPNGNDSNDGLIPSSPLATIKKAIQKGATTVLCKRGNYYNQPPIEFTEQYGKTLKILPYENNGFNSTVLSRPLINLINGNTLNNLTSSNGLLTQTLTPNDHIKDVFINKTKPPIDTSNTRSAGYYSTVWQLHEDSTLDVKLKPVLTLAECKAEVGTFFHDGTNIYINPFSTTYTSFVLPNKSTQIKLNGYSELVLEDIICQFSYNQNFILSNNMNMTIRNCHSKYTMLSDGFSLDNSNGNFYNCTAFKSRNDGFNIHAYGVTNFYNCSGYYNYDDGISHHDGCNGVVDGGEWHHNGKGGVSSPTHGAYIDIYNVECYNNNYGVYAVSASDRRQCVGRVFNSVLYDNVKADIIVEKAKVKTYNTKYTTKQISTNSNTNFIEL